MLFNIENLIADGDNIPTSGTSVVGTPLDYGTRGVVGGVAAMTIVTDVGGSGTINFELVRADDAALSTNAKVVAATGAIDAAELVAGKQINIGPFNDSVGGRYLGIKATASGAPGGGTLTAIWTVGSADPQAYPVNSGI